MTALATSAIGIKKDRSMAWDTCCYQMAPDMVREICFGDFSLQILMRNKTLFVISSPLFLSFP
jgi:hypothetical protein